jgi:phosphoribosyl 1,2-cyclic phosphodiesterase
VTDERLIYLTDSAGIKYDFDRIDYWLIEANYSLEILDKNVENGMDPERANRVINTHMSIEKLKYYFERYPHLDAKEIYLIHLSDDNSDAEAFQKAIERTTGVPVTIA